MEKINIAKLLKDCPRGMELNCTMYEDVYFDYVDELNIIHCYIQYENYKTSITFNQHGTPNSDIKSKCVIFPKGKTTWEGFVPPCQFKVGDWITNGDYTWKVISVDNLDYTLQNQLGEYVDDTIDYVNKAFHLWTINDAKDGDVLFHSDSASNGIFIFNKILQHGTIQKVICYCDYDSEDGFCLGENHTCCWTDSKILHPATKEQCDILFQKIKEAGYKWNKETKTLEKLVEPKFKVWDKIRHKDNETVITITGIKDNYYFIQFYNVRRNDYQNEKVSFKDQDQYELVPNKFDIATLKPFDKVLVRQNVHGIWGIDFFGFYNYDEGYYYTTGNCVYAQCIPYEQNKHLLGTTKGCIEFYKTW